MDVIQNLNLTLLTADDDDVFKFLFKTKEGKYKTVRCLKSTLETNSPAFKDILGQAWDKGSVVMDDDVKFDQMDIFSRFVLILTNVLHPRQLSISVAISIYFYAKKYRVDDLMQELLDGMTSRWNTFKLDEIKDCLELADVDDMADFKASLDCVTLDLKPENVAEFFDICSKYQMEGLCEDIVSFLVDHPSDKSWSKDLCFRVLDLERTRSKEDIADLNEEIAQLSSQLADILTKMETRRHEQEFEDEWNNW